MRSKRLEVRGTRLVAVILTLLTMSFMGCRQEDDVTVIQSQREWVKKTVVVVAPQSKNASVKARLERTADWFLTNFHDAQLHDTLAIDMQIEWHDEDNEDLSLLSREVSEREDIIGVIGPFSNEHVEIFVPACQSNQTPLIAPTATSEEIIRRYAVASAGSTTNKKPFLWSLTESDVSFTETLIGGYDEMFRYDDSHIAYLAAFFSPDNTYGKTFFDWAPFFAQESEVELVCNRQYRSDDELQSKMEEYLDGVLGEEYNTVISSFCVVESMKQMYDVSRTRRKSVINNPQYHFFFDTDDPDDPSLDSWFLIYSLFVDIYFAYNDLYVEALDGLGERGVAMLQGCKGFSPYADPTTGFEFSYEKKFNAKPTFAECKFYDALMIMGFAACYEEHFTKTQDGMSLAARHAAFNNAIVAITTPEDGTLGGAAWNATPMEIYLSELENGHRLQFRGASGDIGFDKDTYTASTHTTYLKWQIVNGEFEHLYYYGKGGSGRLNDAHASWQYLYDSTKAEENFRRQATSGVDISYPETQGQYAVLVQGSEGMANYRHQSGVLSMYQLLKRGGFDDEHIILVMDASLASSTDNNEPGIIRSSKDGENLLEGVVVDYDNADLSPEGIADILKGRRSERLPVVVSGDECTNVLLYWGGHGRSVQHGGSDEFIWRDNPPGKGFTADLMRQTVESMSEVKAFRKLLIIAEACYSENVIKPVEGTTGVMAISGASGEEQSWAENWNPDLGKYGTWMSDRFTMNTVNFLTSNPSATYRDLYLYCTRHTIGSHVRILNSSHFDNLYVTGPKEFIMKSGLSE